MIFKIDFDKWILTVLPTFLRRSVVFAFCRAMCAPIVSLYNRFAESRNGHIYTLTHNGQVCYLRAALNEAFHTTGFEIVDYDDNRGEWHFAKTEGMTGQTYAVDEDLKDPENHPIPLLADEARLNLAMNCFIVQVPGVIYATQLDKVKAVVDKYRILSKTPIYTPI